MSVATSKSVDLGTSMSVDFDDRARVIQDATAATSSSATDNPIGAWYFRNPSLAPNVGHASLGDSASGTHPLMAQGFTSLGDTASGGFPLTALGWYI